MRVNACVLSVWAMRCIFAYPKNPDMSKGREKEEMSALVYFDNDQSIQSIPCVCVLYLV